MSKPINTIEVKEPGTSGETLSQQKLRKFEAFEQEFRDMKKRYYELYDSVKDQMQEGAEVARGKLGLRSGVRYVRRPSYKNEIIRLKGEKYQQDLLNRTRPHAHFYIRLIKPKPKGE